MNTSPSPTAIAWAAELIACSPDPHSRLTVCPPTSTGKSGEEQRHPGDVAVVLAGLVGAAEDDVLDERRVDAGAVDDRAQDGGGEIVRPDARERAAVAADRRADGLDDPGLAERPVGRGSRGDCTRRRLARLRQRARPSSARPAGSPSFAGGSPATMNSTLPRESRNSPCPSL